MAGQLNDDIREMARRSYGYGRWAAPYWFIGPEQGQAPFENDDLTPRVQAWQHFGSRELDDCREFHLYIDESRWHRQERPALQPTWRRLMLLLMHFTERSTDREWLRSYQRDVWGALDGETCIIELSGLAARNFDVSRDRHAFREERISIIRQRMAHHKPKLVVMYGKGHQVDWEALAGSKFPDDNILTNEEMIITCTKHPVSPGLTDTYWVELGRQAKLVAQIGPH